MPNEVSITSRAVVQFAGQTLTGEITFNLSLNAAAEIAATVQTLSTVAANINIGTLDWSEITFMWLKNKSATAAEIVTLVKNGEDVCKLKPGEAYGIRTMGDGTAIQAVSASGTPQIAVIATGTEA